MREIRQRRRIADSARHAALPLVPPCLAVILGLCLSTLPGVALFAQSPFDSPPPSASPFETPAGQDEPPAGIPQSGVSVNDISPWLRDVPIKTSRAGFLPEENELYYRVLAYARTADPQALREAAQEFLKQRWEQSKYKHLPVEKFPVYVDMYLDPQAYQGRPVIMTGHIQRAVVSDAGKNDFAIDQLCETWLFTDDSQANPTVVLSTELPEGFPVGEQAVDHVTVTGYIYRMYTYEARDTGRFAPVLMANRIDWTSPAAAKPDYSWITILLIGVGLAIFSLFIALTLHQQWLLDRESKRTPFEELNATPPESFGSDTKGSAKR
ncbi:hypothetical protein [Rubinisphaera margarita]|uniref:hypothetical protein n=1 Tax=Rubinisphaera margarita TaxID=2909586 RepID=UPI001EE9456D|nr:hypothetical protein [Rubinisphaera margarita]MCG6157546.1 hypothetical protein [Rubinisphaera margarita]